MTKECGRCSESKPLVAFGKNDRYCRPCRAVYRRAWHEANPGKGRVYKERERAKPGFARRKFLRKHGLTPAQFETLFDAQGRVCAICRSNTPNGRGWHIDHDHACCPAGQDPRCGRCFRGILCHGCNVGLGMFADDTDRLGAAIRYLRAET